MMGLSKSEQAQATSPHVTLAVSGFQLKKHHPLRVATKAPLFPPLGPTIGSYPERCDEVLWNLKKKQAPLEKELLFP